jgi:PadR family transcriptional regulator, regulatory protein PadR
MCREWAVSGVDRSSVRICPDPRGEAESTRLPGNERHFMLRDFFVGFVKTHVLYHAVKEPIFGLAMIQELKRHGYEVSPGTLYPMLHNMEAEGLLRMEERLVGGRRRKYYRATDAGVAALGEIREKLRELVEEVVEDRSPTTIADPAPAEEELI